MWLGELGGAEINKGVKKKHAAEWKKFWDTEAIKNIQIKAELLTEWVIILESGEMTGWRAGDFSGSETFCMTLQ